MPTHGHPRPMRDGSPRTGPAGPVRELLRVNVTNGCQWMSGVPSVQVKVFAPFSSVSLEAL